MSCRDILSAWLAQAPLRYWFVNGTWLRLSTGRAIVKKCDSLAAYRAKSQRKDLAKTPVPVAAAVVRKRRREIRIAMKASLIHPNARKRQQL